MLFNGVGYLFLAGLSSVADTVQEAHAAAVAKREDNPKFLTSKFTAEQREKLRLEQETADETAQEAFQ